MTIVDDHAEVARQFKELLYRATCCCSRAAACRIPYRIPNPDCPVHKDEDPTRGPVINPTT